MSTSTIETPVEAVPVLSPEERLVCAEKIVKKNVYCAMGVGIVPIPVVDLLGIAGFQALMIKNLSHLYGVKFNDHVARNLVTALVGTLGTRVIAGGLATSFLKVVPGIGAVVGGLLAVPAVAGAITYAIGRVFIKHFEEGGTLLDLDVDKTRSFFASQYQLGKKVVVATPASA